MGFINEFMLDYYRTQAQAVPGVPAAVLTALLVNILCAVGGSKH